MFWLAILAFFLVLPAFIGKAKTKASAAARLMWILGLIFGTMLGTVSILVYDYEMKEATKIERSGE